MRITGYGIALLTALWLGISSGLLLGELAQDPLIEESMPVSSDRHSSYKGNKVQAYGPRPTAELFSTTRPDDISDYLPCPQPPCRMPCCPPCYKPMALYKTAMPFPAPHMQVIPCQDIRQSDENPFGFYLGFYAVGAKLKADLRNSRGVEALFGDPDSYSQQQLKGFLKGLTAGFEHNNPFSMYQNLEFNWLIGRLHSHHHENQNRFLHHYQAHWRLGYPIHLGCNAIAITPYSGLGYRYVDHHVSHLGECLRYRTFYIPVGLKLNFRYQDFIQIGLNGEWIFPIDSEVKLSSWHQVRWVLKKRQGYSIEMPVSYLCWNAQFELRLMPFYRRFVDGSSKKLSYNHLGYNIRIPKQINQEWGGKILVGISF